MTNEQLFDDLKQFIYTTISQQMANVATKDDIDRIDNRIDTIEAKMATKDDIKHLDQKLKDIQEAIGETLDKVNDETDATLKDHDKRIRRLEHKLA
jgi:hypothetical protein